MGPGDFEGWILKIGLALVAVAGAVWGIWEKVKASRAKLKSDQAKSESDQAATDVEIAAKVRVNRAEADRVKAEIDKVKEKDRAEHYERIIKRTEAQLDKLDKRLDEAVEEVGKVRNEAMLEVEKARKQHAECREELATERERARNRDLKAVQLEQRVAQLENQLEAQLEDTSGGQAH